MFQIRNVDVNFGDYKALKSVSCELHKKDFILVLGHNGAGKSTLFDVISGKILPKVGHIFHKEKEITMLPEQKRACFVSRVFQNTHAGSVASLSVYENLALATLKGRQAGFKLAKNNFPECVVEEILKPLNLGLEDKLQTPIGNLSGGQRQIITIIMATLTQPDILLLDEPTAALDPVSTELVLEFVANYTRPRDLATLMITHDERKAEFLSNKKWRIKKGELETVFV